MHTKKRNRLLHKRLNDIVFVSYNRKMRTRFQLRREKAGKKYDPLVIEEFDWDNEWADSLHVPVPGARGSDAVDDLTWQHVDEAISASQALQGRNLPRVVTFLGELLLLFSIIDAPEMFLLLKMAKRKTKLKTHMMMQK